MDLSFLVSCSERDRPAHDSHFIEVVMCIAYTKSWTHSNATSEGHARCIGSDVRPKLLGEPPQGSSRRARAIAAGTVPLTYSAIYEAI